MATVQPFHPGFIQELAARIDHEIMRSLDDRVDTMRYRMTAQLDTPTMRWGLGFDTAADDEPKKSGLPDVSGKWKKLRKEPIVKEMMPAFAKLDKKAASNRVKLIMGE